MAAFASASGGGRQAGDLLCKRVRKLLARGAPAPVFHLERPRLVHTRLSAKVQIVLHLRDKEIGLRLHTGIDDGLRQIVLRAKVHW